MSQRYDVIVLGSGTNGLVTAATLAKKGKKVLVVEKRATFGGLAAAEEFHPGFKRPGILHDTTQLRRWIVDSLDLAKYGLKFRDDEPPVFAPQQNGRGLLLWRDKRRAEEEIAPHSQKDLKGYADYRAYIDRTAPFLKRVFDDFPPDIMTMSMPGLWDLMKKAVSLRMLGKADMMELLRIAPMCAADWLNEYFENDLLKAALVGPALHGTYTGPWSPGTVLNLLLAESLYAAPVKGGAQAVTTALVAACEAQGVKLMANAEVKSLKLDADGRVHGVNLADGQVIDAPVVAAACDPKQLFLKLVPPHMLTQTFEHNVKNLRSRGTTAKVDLALAALPEWKGRPSLKAEYVRTGEFFDQIERAFDAVKYRETSKEPVLDIYIPTLEDASLAPAGKHVMSIQMHFSSYDPKREDVFERTMAVLDRYAPGIRGLVVGHETLTPKDLETRYNLTGGHIHHVEHAADQLLVRPTPECSRYATPFPGLFLCGSGAHPGGGVTGAPGALAAKAILG